MCSAVPRSGSIIGTRRRGSVPRSNTSESQLALTTEDAQPPEALAPEISPGPAGWLGHRRQHLLLGRTRWSVRAGRTATAPGAGRGTGGPPPRGDGRRQSRPWRSLKASSSLSLATQSTWSGHFARIGLEPVEHVLPALGAPRVPRSRPPGRRGPGPRRTCGPARRAPTAAAGRWPLGRRPSPEPSPRERS